MISAIAHALQSTVLPYDKRLILTQTLLAQTLVSSLCSAPTCCKRPVEVSPSFFFIGLNSATLQDPLEITEILGSGRVKRQKLVACVTLLFCCTH